MAMRQEVIASIQELIAPLVVKAAASSEKMTGSQMAEAIKAAILKALPKSFVNVKFSTNISPSLFIWFASTQKEGWNNGIIQNDPLYMVISIHGFNKEGVVLDKMKLEAVAGPFKGKSIRGKTADCASIIKHITTYFIGLAASAK